MGLLDYDFSGLSDAFDVQKIAGGDPMEVKAINQGLIAAGLSMMGNKGGSVGQALSQGGLLGMQTYGDTMQAGKRDEMQSLQLEQARRDAAKRKALDEMPGQFMRGAQGPEIDGSTGFDSQGYGQALMAVDPRQGLEWQQATAKQDTAQVYDAQGRQVTINKATGQPVYEGAPKLADTPSEVRSYQFAVQQGYKGSFEDWALSLRQASSGQVGLGGPVKVFNPASQRVELAQFPNKPGAAPVFTGMEPAPDKADTMAAAAQSKLQQQQAVAAKAASRDANDALALLTQAEPLLKTATGSWIGNKMDQAGGLVGYSTDGSQAAAKLKALEGALVAKMPKMSGPQSDKDVLMYRQMAAQIGDPTTPAEDRKAAMSVVRQIQERALSEALASLDDSGWTPQPAAPAQQAPQQPAAAPRQQPAQRPRPQPAASQNRGGPVRISNDADFARLPSGSTFIGPDGKTRRKP